MISEMSFKIGMLLIIHQKAKYVMVAFNLTLTSQKCTVFLRKYFEACTLLERNLFKVNQNFFSIMNERVKSGANSSKCLWTCKLQVFGRRVLATWDLFLMHWNANFSFLLLKTDVNWGPWRLFFGDFLGLNFLCEFLKKVLILIVRILIYYFNGSSNASNY